MKRVVFRKLTYLQEEKSNLKTVENLNTCDHLSHHSEKKHYLHTSGTSCFFFDFEAFMKKIDAKFGEGGGNEQIFE